ncbi:MAG: TonB-dependent receptor [Steroidobacter sp.]
MRTIRSYRVRTNAIAASATLGALVAAAGALAQDAEPQSAAALGLEEIIVTAQKRTENIQDVPAAVTVLSGSQIENSGALNVEGLLSLVPTLNFRESVSTIDSSIFLRGVGTINFSIAAEPSVAFVLDGVVQARAGEAFGDLYDIERIEVLRGPQGTLFGKNASGGVVNVVSRKPADEFGGYVDVSAFEDNEYRARASVDLPLGDSVRSRFTATYGSFDGFIRNLTHGRDVNGYERWGMRGILEADVSEKLTLTFIADYREANDDCCAEVIGTVPTGTAAGTQAGVTIDGDETREVRNNLINETIETSWGGSLQADYDLGDGTLTSITAYRDWENDGLRDGDYTDTAFVGIAQLHDYGPQPSTTFTQELRYASPSGKRVEYVVGAYYYEAEAERTFQRDDIVCSASTLPPANGLTPCAPGSSVLTFPSSVATFGSTIENIAAFGQATFNVTDALRLIAGGRYTRDEVSAHHDRIGSLIPGPGVRTDGSGYRLNTDDSDFSPRAGVQYDFSDDLMSYATYARGYKGPAFNVFFNQNPDQLNAIEAETADSYEVGLKSTLFDQRLLFNTAVFYAEYDNFQANNFDLLNGVVITRLTNAGTISTRGVELDLLARPTDNFTLSGGVAYTDAQIDEFNLPPGSPSTDTRKGERLPLAPEWKVSLAANWRVALPTSFDLEFGATGVYTDEQVSDLNNNPVQRPALTIPSYSTVDANIALVDDDERYRVNLMINNVFDESYASLITPGGPGGSYRYLIPRDADRYVGVSVRMNFGR